jgi:hypothetical protein
MRASRRRNASPCSRPAISPDGRVQALVAKKKSHGLVLTRMRGQEQHCREMPEGMGIEDNSGLLCDHALDLRRKPRRGLGTVLAGRKQESDRIATHERPTVAEIFVHDLAEDIRDFKGRVPPGSSPHLPGRRCGARRRAGRDGARRDSGCGLEPSKDVRLPAPIGAGSRQSSLRVRIEAGAQSGFRQIDQVAEILGGRRTGAVEHDCATSCLVAVARSVFCRIEPANAFCAACRASERTRRVRASATAWS